MIMFAQVGVYVTSLQLYDCFFLGKCRAEAIEYCHPRATSQPRSSSTEIRISREGTGR